jgi:hypothetical protein
LRGTARPFGHVLPDEGHDPRKIWLSPDAAKRCVLVAAVALGTTIGVIGSTRPIVRGDEQRCEGSDAAAFHCRNTWIALLKTNYR